MVKLFAPALSLGASGTIGNAITFSKWKGRAYLRERVIPANPKSGLQVGFRSMFKFLAQTWQDLSAPDQANYEALADSLAISPFNAFVKLNQQRWRNFLGPTQAWPPLGAGTIHTYTDVPAATGGVSSIVIGWNPLAVNDNWSVAIFKSTTGFSTALSNCIAVIKSADTDPKAYTDSPLTAGAYFYQTRSITDEGLMGAEEGEITASAT